MPAHSVSLLPKTSLDYIAQGYWRDFLAQQPIAGGIAYNVQLQQCQLDESLISLQRLDTLMTQIRRDISKSAHLNESIILADERYRNLLLFLAFYAGQVLAKHWQQPPHWYSPFEISQRYPDLRLTTDDFYQQMAVIYDYDNGTKHAAARLFFALEPIGLRLFGSMDRQFVNVQGENIASGLYQAVCARLPDKKNTAAVTRAIVKPPMHHPIENPPDTINTVTKNNPPIATESSAPKTTASNVTVPQSVAPKTEKSGAPTPDIFRQLLIELNEIDVPQTVGKSEYQNACKILNQFEKHIAKQDKPRAQVVFSAKHQSARQHALNLLKISAQAGNTTAMLRLAMYELLTEALDKDKKASIDMGVARVKQAANLNDNRAQRLLSKLYYQGIGVSQDINNGQYWLELAAKNGHLEAADLVTQWQKSQALIISEKQEQHSVKRYQILIGIIVIASLLLIVLV